MIKSSEAQRIRDWLSKKKKFSSGELFFLSFDFRISENKAVPVDCNFFPAGFNNLHSSDYQSITDRLKTYFTRLGFESNVIVATENHTTNGFYWDSVITLREWLGTFCHHVIIGPPVLEAISGERQGFKKGSISIVSTHPTHFSDEVRSSWICIMNNDLSVLPFDLQSWNFQRVIPPMRMGWFHRRKITFFHIYQALIEECERDLRLDLSSFKIYTDVFEPFNVEDEVSLAQLFYRASSFLTNLHERKKPEEVSPWIILKNNAGTYGLGVLEITDVEVLKKWTYRMRKKMKGSKGNRKIGSILIQEGVTSRLTFRNFTSELVVYTLEHDWVGSFFRYHEDRSATENLNATGAKFEPLEKSYVEKNFLYLDIPISFATLAAQYEAIQSRQTTIQS